jgi:dephospho-CoA kinase
MNRDHVSEKDALAREGNQWQQEKKVSLSDFVIVNDGEKLVVPQVINIYKEIVNSNK